MALLYSRQQQRQLLAGESCDCEDVTGNVDAVVAPNATEDRRRRRSGHVGVSSGTQFPSFATAALWQSSFSVVDKKIDAGAVFLRCCLVING